MSTKISTDIVNKNCGDDVNIVLDGYILVKTIIALNTFEF